MSSIWMHESVECPFADADLRLRRFFQSNGNRSGDTARLVLSLEAAVPGVARPVALERPVIATIQGLPPRNDAISYRIQWAPEHPGPFPLFAGSLSAVALTTTGRFDLRLAGEYEPPLGQAGAIFDAVAGNRIAQRTAQHLLTNMREFIEHDAKASAVPKRQATA